MLALQGGEDVKLVSGPNGSGKSNLYGALRLLAAAARGDVVGALAFEGGLPNAMWAGPGTVSRAMERGEQPLQGGSRDGPARLRLGFAGEDFGYLIELGMPVPSQSAFDLDPVIKRECVWHGPVCRRASPADGRLEATLRQPGLLRPLGCREWSDGTLRYLLLVAALLTPRPPALMVLNEPETSLHPDLLPPLARLIRTASEVCQVWVVSHAAALVRSLETDPACTSHVLGKSLGRTVVSGMARLDVPPWRWA